MWSILLVTLKLISGTLKNKKSHTALCFYNMIIIFIKTFEHIAKIFSSVACE